FLIAFAIVVGAWIVVASIDAYRVARAVRAGRAEFKKIAALDSSGRMHADALAGMRHVESARRIAHSSFALGVWARVPLLGRPAAWLRTAADATATLSHDASDSIGRIEPALHTTDRTALLRLLDTELSQLATDVARIHLPSTGGF